MTTFITIVFLIAGAAFLLVSGLGAVRFPDLYMRMHAATKAGTLGAGLILVAAVAYFGEVAVTTKAILVFLFLLLTAPVAAHVLGRAAYYDGTPLWDRTRADALQGKYTAGAGARAPDDASDAAGDSDRSDAPPRRDDAT